MSDKLRVGVPAHLLDLPPIGGHGKVWHRILAELRKSAQLIAITRSGGSARRLGFRQPDVVLASGHEDLPSVAVPVVVQVHEAGWFDQDLRRTLDPRFLAHIARCTEVAVRNAARVITPSEAARRDMNSAYRLEPRRVLAVHHGVDSLFRPGIEGGRALVAQARGGEPAPYVLYAASLHPRKNLSVLRNAMATLVRDGVSHVLAIAGQPAPDRPDSSELQRAAAAELPGAPGHVVFLGQPSDIELAALMAGADVFCLPSLYEGFGLTALEAMACGAPVLVSDRGALPEVVGDAGLVVEPTTEGITSGLRDLLGEPERAKRLGDTASVRAAEFSWERAAAGWLEVLLSAARR